MAIDIDIFIIPASAAAVARGSAVVPRLDRTTRRSMEERKCPWLEAGGRAGGGGGGGEFRAVNWCNKATMRGMRTHGDGCSRHELGFDVERSQLKAGMRHLH